MHIIVIMVVSALLLLGVSFLFVEVLLAVAKRFKGAAKTAIGFPVFSVYALLLVLPMFGLITIFKDEIDSSATMFVPILAIFSVILAPSLYYIFKIKIRELQRAGYYVRRENSSN